jgi:two-component system, OmpR family, sensor histidine kinase BaeS
MFRTLSISTKFFITFSVVFAIGISISVYINNTLLERQMQTKALESARQEASIVRESLVNMMMESKIVDDAFLERIKSSANLTDLYIRIDTNRLRLAYDFNNAERSERFINRIARANSHDDTDNRFGNAVLNTGEEKWFQVGNNFRAMIPIKAEQKCQRCHDVQVGDIMGVAHIEFPLTPIIELNEKNSFRSAAIFGGTAVVVLGIGFLFFRMFVRTPMKKLEKATEDIGKGNMNEELELPESNDEVGQLAQSFVHMRTALRVSQDAMRISTVEQIATSLVQDFRAPIKEIESAIDELKNNQVDENKKLQLLTEAKEAANLVNEMTQDLLDFTSGTVKIQKTLSSVLKLLRSVTTIVRPDLDKQNITLDVLPLYDGIALFDPDRTARALDNIITYAANYIPSGGFIRLESDTQGSTLLLKISDNGNGIPEQFRGKIFEPFFKIVRGKGVGLDLALAKQIIEQQGGQIDLQSEENQGTTYFISLPM